MLSVLEPHQIPPASFSLLNIKKQELPSILIGKLLFFR